jgi:site-specific DNA recombinase
VTAAAGGGHDEGVLVVAGYIRLTRDESVKTGLSAPAQRAGIEEYTHRAGLPPPRIYQEPEAVGGDVPFERRKAFSELAAAICAGRVAHLIVRDIDRLTRDVVLWVQLVELCQAHGVAIHTLSGELATRSPTDRFSTTVRAAVAQLEKDQVSDRVRQAKREMARQGRHVGGPPPYGYTSQSRRQQEAQAGGLDADAARLRAATELPLAKRLYVDPAEAEVVRLVFDWYVDRRWGSRQIARELTRRGFRRRSGLPWHPDKVRRLIHNPVVAGLVAYDEAFFQAGRGRRTPKGEQAVYPGGHDAIIPEDLWRRAQEVRRTNAARVRTAAGGAAGGPTPFVLGGVLRCRCGAGVRAGGYRAGSRAAYYVCLKRYHWGTEPPHGCGHARLRADRVHAAFWGAVEGLLAAPDLADRVLAAAQAKAARIRAATGPTDPTTELRRVARDLEIWYRRHDVSGSDLEREAAWARIVQLTARKKEIEAGPAVTSAACTSEAVLSRETVARFLSDLAGGLGRAPDYGRAVVRALVERHALTARVAEPTSISVELALAAPGCEATAVRLAADARIPSDRICAP